MTTSFKFSLSKFFNIWTIVAVTITCIVIIPLFILCYNFFTQKSDVWQHLVDTVLTLYITNTLIACLGIGFFSLVIGISTAWVVSVYRFPGRKIFNWALMLPLAIPSYVAAYTYAGIFDYTGVIQTYSKNIFGADTGRLDIMTMENIILILSFVLYPYVFIICRASFSSQSASIIDAAKLFGHSSAKRFFKIILPLARPAIISSAVIVIMEVLNDYGAMKYFGISTFTVAIIQVWFAFNDVNAAIRLSMYLMFIVLAIILAENMFRGKAKYDTSGGIYKPLQATKIYGAGKWIPFMICFIPLLIGFIIPTFQLIIWAFKTASTVVSDKFWILVSNSFLLATISSVVIVALGLLLVYTTRINYSKFIKSLVKISSIGYILPGAVAAVGVLVPFLFIHNILINWLEINYNPMFGLIIGSFLALGFAYLVRFLVLAINPLESTLEKAGKNIEEAARSLGASNWKILLKIDIPILKNAILAALILIFVNILKEIPLTIILRPFNFDTLAIKGFELAKNEQVAESAILSLLIILVGLIPILFLNKITLNKIK